MNVLPLDFIEAEPVRGRPLIIDSFAGGGGASTGIEMALGRSPDVAINHDAEALAMHEVNHPETLHMQASVYAVDPREVTGRRPVGLMWFSPDCSHHSKAKGGKPVEKNVRDLAWVVVHYAELVSPDVIMLENVEEFQDWCPLTPDHKPDLSRKGETFRAWVRELRRLGYKVEWRELRACDYGAPTIRKRLFVIARRDGLPIVWPEPTHGAPDSPEVIAGTRKPWRTAAEIIDWSLPCPSIFDSSAEIMAKHGLRAVRPLKDATLRRIARGVMRYVVEAKEPFIVTCNHAGPHFRGQGLGEPLNTLTAARDANGLVVPTLIQTGYGERPGQDPRVPGLEKPIGTMVAGGAKHALVAAFLAQHNAGARMENNAGRAATDPLSTLTTRGTQQQVVAATLVTNTTGHAPTPMTGQVPTLTTGGHQAMVAASMVNLRGTADGQLKGLPIDAPVPTVSAGGGHAGLVAAFLQKYYGAGTGQTPVDPLHTLGTRDTFGLVTVEIDGATYAIADIGMRMLTPREQFRAQGFPDSYIIDRGPDGSPMTKTAQTRMCGNSVCPPLAAALARANCAHLAEVR